MDKIRKLFARLPHKERLQLQSFLDTLLHDHAFRAVHAKKLTGSDLYRARKGRFRIIFHDDDTGAMIIDSVRIRNEHTYKDV